MMQASKVTHESGRWTITTGQGKTVFRDEQSAAEQIAILQQEIERLKAELAEQITRAEDAEEESATAAGEIERLQHDATTLQALSFCESVTATSISPWCIRPLTKNGRKCSGGVDTASLCGRVRIGFGWDIDVLVTFNHPKACPRCLARLKERI